MAAAVGAAGIVASQAQVFSVNAVGYVNKTIPANGYAMLANPLKAATNTINALFAGVPNGFQVYVFTPGKGYTTLTFDDLDNSFGAGGNTELLPGQGVFVRSPSEKTITFVGEVMQGNLTTQLVAGLQIVSSQVPQQGTATELGLTGAPGDQIFQFDVLNQRYVTSTYDDLDNKFLAGANEARFDVGEAFFIKKAAAGTWTRNFNVNTP
jgi:hypothetical protein